MKTNNLLLLGWGAANNQILNILKDKYKKKKIVNVFILDKYFIDNFGGIAYGIKTSRYGYFNNPCRLSPKNFISWCLNTNNKKKIIYILKKKGGESGKNWLIQNEKNFLKSNKLSDLDELYLPRFAYGLWLKDIYSNTPNKYIKVFFFKTNQFKIKKEKNFFILKIKNKKKILVDFISISLGINLPQTKKISHSNYIKNFYIKGSTSYLIRKLNKILNDKIKVLFLGTKAGFLEPLIELKHRYSILKKLSIIGLSRSSEVLNKAYLGSIEPKIYYLNKKKFIFNAQSIYECLLKEFKIGRKKNFSKYDIWTAILKYKLLDFHINKFNKKEKKIFQENYLKKIRSLTRFTYSESVKSYELLKKKSIIKMMKGEVLNITQDINSKKFKVMLKNDYVIDNIDIIVDVRGPRSIKSFLNYESVGKILKNIDIKYNDIGIEINRNCESANIKNLFIPGTLGATFNPTRKTIIKAINDNSNKVSKLLLSRL